jgi:hypothetical protein
MRETFSLGEVAEQEEANPDMDEPVKGAKDEGKDEGSNILAGMALGDSTPRERCREPRIPTTIADKGEADSSPCREEDCRAFESHK